MAQNITLDSTPALIRGRRAFLASGLSLAPLAMLSGLRSAEGANNNLKIDKRLFRSIQKHENDHVDFLVLALGSEARPKPKFKGLRQDKLKDFLLIAQALENTGVGAYLGAAPALSSSDYLAAAGSIMTIEARHAGAINVLLDDPVSTENDSFDVPLTPAEVGVAAGEFIADLNGGPALDYSSTPSEANDIAILNFALALEFLEAQFYNANEKFYS